MIKQWLTKSTGTKWIGNGELWLDSEGKKAYQYS